MRHYIKNFMQHEAAGGIFLMLAALCALVCANSGLAELYKTFLQTPIQLSLSIETELYGLSKTIQVWINDVFMTIFFLVVGLEIKREILVGELSTRAKLLQPLFAAIGGVVIPAAIFFLVNRNHPQTAQGWAIPCATDIAFALGVLALLGSRVPARIKVLLTAIAIIDDLAAVIIIALFYSTNLYPQFLIIAAIGMGLLVMLNRSGSVRISLYVLSGILVWYGFLKTGIHPTMAGIVTAMFVPLQTEKDGLIVSPLMRVEHALHRWVIFGVLPLFAFVNSGLDLNEFKWSDLNHHLTIGIMLGLLLGKPVGVMGGLFFGKITKLAPVNELDRYDYIGLSMLCAIGFTMSLFIGELAFPQGNYHHQFKLGILMASLLAAVLGWLICFFNFKSERKPNA